MKKNIGFFGHTLVLSGLKRDIDHMTKHLYRLSTLEYRVLEKKGTIGVSESSTERDYPGQKRWTMTKEQRSSFQGRIDEVKQIFPEPVIKEQFDRIWKKHLEPLYYELLPIEDTRMTVEQEKEQAIQDARRMTVLKEIEQAIDLGCDPPEEITWDGDEMGVCIQATIDLTDMKLSSNEPLTDKYALTILHRTGKREHHLRDLVARIPRLKDLTWEVYTEYTKGNVMYLACKGAGSIHLNDMDHSYNLRISHELNVFAMQKSVMFIETPKPVPYKPNFIEGAHASVHCNYEKHGVEIKFLERPGDGVISKIRDAGFRWSKLGQLWYQKYRPEALEAANEIAGTEVEWEENESL